jgi:tRNA threonylcarbamoyladenosine biosynthesis protein TsaB
VNDARMREVYWAEYRVGNHPELVAGEHVTAGGEVQLPSAAEAWVAAGRGLRASPDLARRCRQAGADLYEDLLPRAAEVLLLAGSAVAAGQILPPERALPVYVRDRVVAAAR